ncbi:hypothetical protein Pla52o_11680 [Novipirellula galeiformis]|uniref:HEPN domain-containing protein n=1 Tax=Novipirellula galeiformis TaxID=2528004 RepID=A0A5C6CJ76_9BACT|nr:hypothetical protein [Novipirellula galeiformis]TWU24873.1 hypothetical protein Pla52o_11680 [Novipirellula galeiformis]
MNISANITFGISDSFDSANIACIGYAQAELIAEGFRDAANILAFQALENESSLDTLIFPIAFSFRHAFELKLKTALLLSSLIENCPKLPEMSHDLSMLWRRLKPHVESRFVSHPEYPRIPEIEEILKDFQTVDSGFLFRYATDPKGIANLQRLPNVDIELLQRRANLLYSLLDQIEGVFDGDWSGCD